MLELKEHKHAAVIRDYYEALASGRIEAGWYEMQARRTGTYLCQILL